MEWTAQRSFLLRHAVTGVDRNVVAGELVSDPELGPAAFALSRCGWIVLLDDDHLLGPPSEAGVVVSATATARTPDPFFLPVEAKEVVASKLKPLARVGIIHRKRRGWKPPAEEATP